MSKIRRGEATCPQCGRDIIRVKSGQRLKAKGYQRERCLVCGYYLKKN